MARWDRILDDEDPFADSLYNNETTSYMDNTNPYYAEKTYEPVNYTVVSVGIMTLGLIVVVELIRHQLDHVAIKRPFYKAVLQGVYSECK